MADWEDVTSGLEHGGYVAWEAAIDATRPGPPGDHVAVFARIVPTDQMTLLQAIDATLALTGLRVSRHERDLLKTDRALAAAGRTDDVRIVAFWPRASLQTLPAFWDIRQIGPGLSIAADASAQPGDDLATIEGDLDPAIPVAAIIDDGIGFLNARFRRNQTETRIKAVWLQANERQGASGDIQCGKVLSGSEIDEMLRNGEDEADVYRRLNRELYPIGDTPLAKRHAAHGTHVLDLAAGAAPWDENDVGQIPILAVQLPPSSIRETSGRRLETYLLQGLRWVLAEVLRQAKGTDAPPVVVNISLGSLAGPGDRHAFVAEWFRYELARHERITGAQVRLVVAYGNARIGRLVAWAELRRNQAMELLWRVLPDDHTASYLELRAELTQTAGLRLRIVPPKGAGLPTLDIPWPAPGTGKRLPGPIALVSAASEGGGQSLVHIALGLTVNAGASVAAPAGAWQIEVHTAQIEPVYVTARVQRDDTPPGYRTLGRQSWLDHPRGWDWDAELRGYLAPRAAEDAPGCPVTREGTAVAYAGADDPRILFVGAARPVIGAPGEMRPTSYSAEGVRHLARPDESRGPTLIALGDGGTIGRGMPAAGVVSGATSRMSGTSIAAPQVTRSLLHYFLTTPKEAQTPEAETEWLLGEEAGSEIDARRGRGSLVDRKDNGAESGTSALIA